MLCEIQNHEFRKEGRSRKQHHQRSWETPLLASPIRDHSRVESCHNCDMEMSPQSCWWRSNNKTRWRWWSKGKDWPQVRPHPAPAPWLTSWPAPFMTDPLTNLRSYTRTEPMSEHMTDTMIHPMAVLMIVSIADQNFDVRAVSHSCYNFYETNVQCWRF